MCSVVESKKEVEITKQLRIVEENIVDCYVSYGDKVKNTTPTVMEIGSESIVVSNWKDVYAKAFKYLTEHYPSVLSLEGKKLNMKKGVIAKEYTKNSIVILSKDKSEVTTQCKDKGGIRLSHPVEIVDGLYLQYHGLSAMDIFKRVRVACEVVGLSKPEMRVGVIQK